MNQIGTFILVLNLISPPSSSSLQWLPRHLCTQTNMAAHAVNLCDELNSMACTEVAYEGLGIQASRMVSVCNGGSNVSLDSSFRSA